MAHVYEGAPDGRQSNERIAVSRFRPTYRALSDTEKALHDSIKTKAVELEALFEMLTPSRELSLGMTNLEQAVMWAVKSLTGAAGMKLIHTDPAAAYDAYSTAGCQAPSGSAYGGPAALGNVG